MITPNYPREETAEEATRRFEIECEFVQSLANPNYLNYLAQRGYFKEQYFINYLRYLLYFKRPEYARTLKYPQCLYMLEAVQHAEFRDALAFSTSAKYIEDQLLLQWHFYLRKRTRLSQFVQVDDSQKHKSTTSAERDGNEPDADQSSNRRSGSNERSKRGDQRENDENMEATPMQ